MSFGLILILAVVLVVLSAVAGAALFVRFLTGESEADAAMRFDPFARPPPPPSLRLFGFLMFLRNRPKQIGSRRDRLGRFRKRER
jgi:flagellar basal body-associated protein FliL